MAVCSPPLCGANQFIPYTCNRGLPLDVQILVPFASSHARHDVVMRTCGLGLMHRLLMDTLDKDVHLLLPTLLLYHAELCLVGYPPSFLSRVFRIFLRHPKVAKSLAWHDLFARFETERHF